PVGYADGYPRSLSNRGRVLIHGKYAPIRGRICMDQFMVDVTEIPEARQGDVVTLFGKDGREFLPVEEVAELAGSFHYEFVCGISKRVPRIYLT
ncbi:MAG TPA: alanine racemase, partial [Candidatus Caccomorpha excrementavium]|nr:alanine racemase [Candidatus Caccomorpha excrementavium]